jgi:periplasmic copper chaperone A
LPADRHGPHLRRPFIPACRNRFSKRLSVQVNPRPFRALKQKAKTMKRIAILLSAAVLGLSTAVVSAEDYKLGSLEIEHPYARATPPNAPVSGGYMIIRNSGGEADRLISGEASFAERVEIHEMAMDGEVMKMRQLADGLEIPAGGEVVLKPGGYHVMFIGIDSQFKDGETRNVKLTFEKAGSIDLEFEVKDMKAMQGQMKMDGTGNMDHGKMGHGQMKQGG